MMIDLRSDTVTKPNQPMLEAMLNAQVGDDVFKEDPTVNTLEEKTARLFGMEAGLFCPSGTMANQIAIKIHTQPGDEVICDATAHIYNYESGGMAFNSSVQAKLISGDRGRISPGQVTDHINPTFDWLTTTTLLSIENTANKAGGSCYTLPQMEALSTTATKHGLKFHLDGARIFNALTAIDAATGQPEKLAKTVGSYFDSVSVCLSKGLGAPSGSVLLGNNEFIRKARRIRKVLGGGMRQAGYLAAAGIYALENNISRLKEDHRRAKQLEQVLTQQPYISNVLPVETNIIIFTLAPTLPAERFIAELAQENINASIFGKQTIRFVTHLDINDTMVSRVEEVLKKLAAKT